MDKLTSEEIKEKISPILNKAKKAKGSEIRYWLEQLPMNIRDDYDEEIHNFISVLESAIRLKDDIAYDLCCYEMFDFYENVQEFYEF